MIETDVIKKFKVGLYRFTISPLDRLFLPEYKGATFRGGFGYTFKKIVCTMKSRDCKKCMLRDKCVYSYIFETPVPSGSSIMKKYPYAPHPFIIEPPLGEKKYFDKGDELSFNIILIGRAIEYLPYFIYTFKQLGKDGLGKNRIRYILKTVHIKTGDDTEKEIYRSEDEKLYDYDFTFGHKEFLKKWSGGDVLKINFITPTRIRFNGRITSGISFDIIIRSLLRRISMLSYFHLGEEAEIDFKGIIEESKKIEVSDSALKWYDWARYSTRQNERIKLGGFIGLMKFQGDFKKFYPFLRIGEFIHIGKGTTFGMGKYRLLFNREICKNYLKKKTYI